MDVVVRCAESRDLPGLLALNKEFNGISSTVKSMEESLRSSDEMVFVAVFDGEVIAFACGIFWQSMFWPHGLLGGITELFVKSKHQRKGVATKLIKALENGLRSRNVTKVILVTTASNTASRSFYESQGYCCGHDSEIEITYEKSLN